MRCPIKLALVVLLVVSGGVWAGHTRPGYVDGCQSMGGRYVVTAAYDTVKKQWQYTWKDTKENKTLTGPLVGIADCQQGHFDVAYVHMFVAPDGETFATWNPASWAGFQQKIGRIPERESAEYKNYAGFNDRLVVYRKTGEIVKRLGIKDFLQDSEWNHVHHVQGNLYWLGESPDYGPKSNGEPPRCGYRYYRVSPDYTVLEVYITPDREVQAKFKSVAKPLAMTRRVVRIDMTTGNFLSDDGKADPNKVAVRAYLGEFTKRGDGMKAYLPSLDPVRVPGKYKESSEEK